MTYFRQLAAASGGGRVALCTFERVVSVWNLDPPGHVATFPTILDFGGSRLALSEEGATVVCGAYGEGVAAYSAETGQLIWQRRDIKRPQRISTSTSRRIVYVAPDDGPCLVLSLDSGEIVDRLRGVRWVVESPFSPHLFLDRRRPAVVGQDLETLIDLPRTTFAFLDVAFGPASVAVTEAGGPVRCIDLASRRELWTFTPSRGIHCLTLAFCPDRRSFVGVLWPFERGGPKELVAFDDSGSRSVLADLGASAEECFCRRGSILLVSSGSMVHVSSGVVSPLAPTPA